MFSCISCRNKKKKKKNKKDKTPLPRENGSTEVCEELLLQYIMFVCEHKKRLELEAE